MYVAGVNGYQQLFDDKWPIQIVPTNNRTTTLDVI